MTVIVTGSQGFIGSYICQEFLANGFEVIGIDNYSKYGRITRPQDKHQNFRLIEDDLRKNFPIAPIYSSPKYIICCAARIGGIEYFHKIPFDLLLDNELILANTFNFLLKSKTIEHIVMLSSSMVYETDKSFPSQEFATEFIPPPQSAYGFQKLAAEYWCKAFHEQYGLPYTIIRPFNAVGIGEDKAISNNQNITLSHVIPDFVEKALRKQNPFEIYGDGEQTRCFTNCKDVARGIYLATISPDLKCQTYNIASNNPIKMWCLARLIWQKINGSLPLTFKYLPAFKYDTRMRIPDINMARGLLNFEAKITLDESIDEVIDYIKFKTD
jgi:nucleoside-diphosphate-sugar epimerase